MDAAATCWSRVDAVYGYGAAVPEQSSAIRAFYETRFTPGGCHVPLPGGRIEGGSVFGQ